MRLAIPPDTAIQRGLFVAGTGDERMENEELERKIENFLRDLLKGYISELDLTTLLNCVEEIGNMTEIERLIKIRINAMRKERRGAMK